MAPRVTPREVAVAPVIGWRQWYARQAATYGQGSHKIFAGPTQSGKTLLCRKVARLRNYVVVFGTKPVDPSLDAYVAEGYVRIDHWPPTKKDYDKAVGWSPPNEARFILWPVIKSREELRAFADAYRKCMDEVFIEGKWCIVVDEGLWMASNKGLGLGDTMGELAYGSASNKVNLYVLCQRLSNVGPIVWTSAEEALVFKSGRTADMRELASLGTYEPKDVQAAVRRLHGHQFLDVPCRGMAEWSISEVEL